MAKKQSSIQICDAKPSKKNPNAKYIVKSVGKNGESLQTSEALNDVKAVKTNITAICECYSGSTYVFRPAHDHTKLQKFFKAGYAVSGLKK